MPRIHNLYFQISKSHINYWENFQVSQQFSVIPNYTSDSLPVGSYTLPLTLHFSVIHLRFSRFLHPPPSPIHKQHKHKQKTKTKTKTNTPTHTTLTFTSHIYHTTGISDINTLLSHSSTCVQRTHITSHTVTVTVTVVSRQTDKSDKT